jgi:hypothetical protein
VHLLDQAVVVLTGIVRKTIVCPFRAVKHIGFPDAIHNSRVEKRPEIV